MGRGRPIPQDTGYNHAMIPGTRRLFHEDPFLTRFDATVTACREAGDGQFVATLDQTAFYADSGGQPHDTGRLGDAVVLDVRDADGILEHRLDRAVDPGPIVGSIDWDRRFDHMQQHTGQHVLSRAFIETGKAETTSFHLGTDRVTIDLDRPDWDDAFLSRAEECANRIVQENRPVLIHWTDPENVNRFPLRKPPTAAGPLRIVEVRDFDFSACGGTHVGATGQIGLVKILRAERNKGGVRVEFLCGGRAVADYGWKHELVQRTAARYSTLDRDLEGSLLKLEEEAAGLRRQVRDLTDIELGRRACEIAGKAVERGGIRITLWSGDVPEPGIVKGLGQKLKACPNMVSLLAGTTPDGRTHLVFARGEGSAADLGAALQAALPAIEGKGGGRGDIVQGSGPAKERAREALEIAARKLEEGTG